MTAALAVVSWAAVEDGFVGHLDGELVIPCRSKRREFKALRWRSLSSVRFLATSNFWRSRKAAISETTPETV